MNYNDRKTYPGVKPGEIFLKIVTSEKEYDDIDFQKKRKGSTVYIGEKLMSSKYFLGKALYPVFVNEEEYLQKRKEKEQE